MPLECMELLPLPRLLLTFGFSLLPCWIPPEKRPAWGMLLLEMPPLPELPKLTVDILTPLCPDAMALEPSTLPREDKEEPLPRDGKFEEVLDFFAPFAEKPLLGGGGEHGLELLTRLPITSGLPFPYTMSMGEGGGMEAQQLKKSKSKLAEKKSQIQIPDKTTQQHTSSRNLPSKQKQNCSSFHSI